MRLQSPFELLIHAEGHLVSGDDFDRRIALISFDNAIEVAITTYLTLNPIQRANRTYTKVDVEKWLDNYHTKLTFLETELVTRTLTWDVEKSHIIWCHDQRNDQYHGGRKGTPEKRDIELIRKAALWIFSVLYDDTDTEKRLAQALLDTSPPAPPSREDKFDRAIDREHGLLDIGGRNYYASEVLFAVDYVAYREEGERLCAPKSEEKVEEV